MSEKKWAVIDRAGVDEFVDVCESKEAAIKEARGQWHTLTSAEKKNREIIVGLISVNADGRPFAEDDKGNVDGDIYEICDNWNLEALRDKYGSATFDGKEYTLIDQSYCDIYGDSECYFCTAITGETDEEGRLMEYKVRWNETEEWSTQSATHKRLYAKKCDSEHGGEPLTAEEHDDLYRAETYCQDESNACDWDNPADVHMI